MKDKENHIEEILEKIGVFNGSDIGGKTYIVRPQDLETELLKYYKPKEKQFEVVGEDEQVEEMANIISDCTWVTDEDYCDSISCEECHAKRLYEKGFKKLPEDRVVLSREEYEEYKKVADGKAIMVENITDLNKLVQFPIEYNNLKFEYMDDYSNYIQDEARKETAEKIFSELYEKSFIFSSSAGIFSMMIEKFIDLAKRFGVSIAPGKGIFKPESEAKLIKDEYYDHHEFGNKCQCPHCDTYFDKGMIGFKIEDDNRYFYCPFCGGKLLLK